MSFVLFAVNMCYDHAVTVITYKFRRLALGLALLLFHTAPAVAQGVAGDLLAGTLVKPKVGQWAWYDLADAATGMTYAIRQAIVGEENVGRKTGYWMECEIAPQAGYKSIYKMLLTGPANDPKNVHKVVRKQGPEPPEELSVSDAVTAHNDDAAPKRKSLGIEDVTTSSGVMRAEHYSIAKDGRTIDLWINEEVPPTGIIRIRSADGEMTLRNFGQGGTDGQSVITDAPADASPAKGLKVIVNPGNETQPKPSADGGRP
ncbi:MAG: hypothetical protein HY706_12900 [Candidatus Hydrogenedentes bacterium]|nr:hypothetical protein [Candidatus Hydrogenedentota bacterium]